MTEYSIELGRYLENEVMLKCRAFGTADLNINLR
jgi:hypothetical protein